MGYDNRQGYNSKTEGTSFGICPDIYRDWNLEFNQLFPKLDDCSFDQQKQYCNGKKQFPQLFSFVEFFN